MGKNVRNDDEVRETPSTVVWAVASGTAALPFLAVYAVMFIVHGGIHRVVPPDITSSSRGELIAGIIALALFVVDLVALFWMMNGRRRWPFLLVQLGMLGTAIDFFIDVTKGGRFVSFVVALASLAAIVCALLPPSWAHFDRTMPTLRRPRRTARTMPIGAGPASDTLPDSPRFVGDRDRESV
jgi:hypothetical protein